jgi:hypothetical protein
MVRFRALFGDEVGAERDRRSPIWDGIAGVAVAHFDNSARDLSPCQRREFEAGSTHPPWSCGGDHGLGSAPGSRSAWASV